MKADCVAEMFSVSSEAEQTLVRVMPSEMKDFFRPALQKCPEKISVRSARLFNAFLEQAPVRSPSSNNEVITDLEARAWLKKIGHKPVPGNEDLSDCLIKSVQRMGYDKNSFEELGRRDINRLVIAIEGMRRDCKVC